jgi:hypothetical protein
MAASQSAHLPRIAEPFEARDKHASPVAIITAPAVIHGPSVIAEDFAILSAADRTNEAYGFAGHSVAHQMTRTVAARR